MLTKARIERESNNLQVTIPDSGTQSGIVDFRSFTMGVLHLPAGWTTADITFEVASEVDDTFQTLYYEGSVVTISGAVASTSHVLPPSLAGARFWRVVSSVSQAGGDDIVVDRKA